MASQALELRLDMLFLVIDDASASRETVVLHLKTLGFKNVLEISNEGDALRILKEKEFNFILCQKGLQQANGLELLTQIRENIEIKRTPLLLYGTDLSKEDLQIYPEANPDGFLRYPCMMKEVSVQISTALRRYSDKENIEAKYEAARLLYIDGEYQKAYDLYKGMALRNQSSSRLFIGMAKCLRAIGNSDGAERYLRQAISNNKKHIQGYIELGICLLSQEKKQLALRMFDQSLQLNPKNPVRYEEIAGILTRLELYSEAEEYLMRAVNNKVVYPKLYAQIGKNFVSQNKKEKALEFFQRAIDQDPKNPSFFNSIGICYKEMGRFDEAITNYNLALKINPNDVKIMYNKVLCLVNIKEYDRAKKICLQILNKDQKFDRATAKLVEIDRLEKEAPIAPKFRGVRY